MVRSCSPVSMAVCQAINCSRASSGRMLPKRRAGFKHPPMSIPATDDRRSCSSRPLASGKGDHHRATDLTRSLARSLAHIPRPGRLTRLLPPRLPPHPRRPASLTGHWSLVSRRACGPRLSSFALSENLHLPQLQTLSLPRYCTGERIQAWQGEKGKQACVTRREP